MNRRDLIMITGIAIGLLAAVFGVEVILRGLPEVLRDIELGPAKPSLSVRSRSNVREGDAISYSVVGKLQVGEMATILGVSQGSAGWYYIELPDGTRGFISPDVVSTEGDLSNLETIDPASLIATATPPTVTAIPTQPAANAVATEQTDEPLPATPTVSG